MVNMLLLIIAFSATAILCGLWRKIALRYHWMDTPNRRSSHHKPIPRSGGVAMVVVWFAILAWLAVQEYVEPRIFLALWAGGLPIVLISYLDDRLSLPAFIRFFVHFLAAIAAVFALGGLPVLWFGDGIWHWGVLGDVFAVLWIIWLTNLYNFMDGIDGLAAGQAVLTGAAAAILLLWQGAHVLALLCALCASVSAGFLIWNWSPAKLFMGDIGSAWLGFTFAVLALASANMQAVSLPTWYLLLAVFIVDTTATLLRRVGRGERWYEAHRSHAYQCEVQKGKTHSRVTMAILWIGFLLSLAAAGTVAKPILTLPIFLMSTGTLLWIWWQLTR